MVFIPPSALEGWQCAKPWDSSLKHQVNWGQVHRRLYPRLTLWGLMRVQDSEFLFPPLCLWNTWAVFLWPRIHQIFSILPVKSWHLCTSKNSLVEDSQEKEEWLFASSLFRVLTPNFSCGSFPSREAVSHVAGAAPVPTPFVHYLAPHCSQNLLRSCEEQGLMFHCKAFHLLASDSYQYKVQPSCSGGRSLNDPKRRYEHFLLFFCLPSKQQEEVALVSPLLSPSLSIFGTCTETHAQSNLVCNKIILR